MMFLGVALILVLGIHYIAKAAWKEKENSKKTALDRPMPNLSQDGEFNVEIEREFQNIVEGIKKEQQ